MPTTTTPSTAANRGHSVILVVDDEDDIRESMRDLIEATTPNAEVLVAGSAAEAKGILHKRQVDLILTDYRMPGTNGIEFLSNLGGGHPAKRVLMTAYPDLSVAQTAASRGRVEAFLQKPVDPAQVITLVQKLLRGTWSEKERDEGMRDVFHDLERRDVLEE